MTLILTQNPLFFICTRMMNRMYQGKKLCNGKILNNRISDRSFWFEYNFTVQYVTNCFPQFSKLFILKRDLCFNNKSGNHQLKLYFLNVLICRFQPSVLLYLISVIPAIWLLEIDNLKQLQTGNSTSSNNDEMVSKNETKSLWYYFAYVQKYSVKVHQSLW